MTIANLAFPLALTALVFGLAAVIARASPWYADLLAQHAERRYECIDGVRGFLALGVLFTHVMTTRGYYAFGAWDASFAPFFVVSGQAGVSLFFMVTAFLFWSRVLKEGTLDTGALYRSRLRRLVPMYLASVALVLLIVAALSEWRLRVEPVQLAREVRAWLAFGFMETGDVNGVKDAHIINAVYWTLAFEWGFYALLPFMAFFARGRAFLVLVALIVFFGVRAPITLNFLAGMLVAWAAHRKFLDARLASPWLAPIPLGAIGVVITFDTAYTSRAIALMAVFFVFVAAGNSFFGVLRTAAAQLLGRVSYSFYLLHCVFVYVAFRVVDAVTPAGGLDAWEHWAIACAAAAVTVLVSVVTYRRIEYPFIARRAPQPHPGAAILQRAPVA